MKLGFLLFALPFLGMIAICSVTVFKVAVAFGVLRSPLARQITTWVFILIPVALLITMAVSSKVYNVINIFFYHIAMVWLPVLLYLFLAAILLAIINFIAVSTGGSAGTGAAWAAANMYILSLCALVLVLGATAFGIANASMPRIVTYEIDSPALSKQWAGKNIVLVSDTHLGIVRSKGFMDKVVKKINGLNPDVVFIAGDIIDGPVFNYQRGLNPLKNIQSTYGVIYTPGNHEGYNTEPEKFYPIMKSLVTTVIDSKVEVNGADIIGLDYKSEPKEATAARLKNILGGRSANTVAGSVPLSPATAFPAGLPTIALLHDPSNASVLQDAGIDLVLSGHTHCGQFFPINLIVKRIYKEYTYGVTERASAHGKKTFTVTTCGVGTAMSPLRLGTNPEIVVLHIK